MSSANKAIQMMLSKRSKDASRKDEIRVKYTDVHNLIPNENNIYPIVDIDKLAFCIKMSGDITPLTLRPRDDGKFTIISGHRRTKAILYLLEQDSTFNPMVPYIEARDNDVLGFLDAEDKETLAICLPNEGQRRDLTPAEKADVLKRMRPVIKKIYDQGREDGTITDTHFRKFFADFLDMSEAQIQRGEAYNKLSESLKKDVDEGLVAPSVAVLLSGKDADVQDDIVRQIRESGQELTKQSINNFLHPPVEESAKANDFVAQDLFESSAEPAVGDGADEQAEDFNSTESASDEADDCAYCSSQADNESEPEIEIETEAEAGEPGNTEADEPAEEYSQDDMAEGGEDDNESDTDELVADDPVEQISEDTDQEPSDDTEGGNTENAEVDALSEKEIVEENKQTLMDYYEIISTLHTKKDLVEYIDMLRHELDTMKEYLNK